MSLLLARAGVDGVGDASAGTVAATDTAGTRSTPSSQSGNDWISTAAHPAQDLVVGQIPRLHRRAHDNPLLANSRSLSAAPHRSQLPGDIGRRSTYTQCWAPRCTYPT